jgi:predicted nucleic acid-binding protein
MAGDFVVDNSVVMAWCFLEEENEPADAALDALTRVTAHVPSVWPLEVLNVLLAAERRNRIGPADSTRFLELLEQLPIEVENEDVARRTGDLLHLSRACGLSSYDASYLDLALRKGMPLATADRGLIRAARKCQVSLFSSHPEHRP